MLITDPNGKYEIRIDADRLIVYEKNMGIWNRNDIHRYDNDFLNKVLPIVGGKEWFKCSDLREYELSDINKEITNHVSWCVQNGLFGAIIIVKNETVKMQMNLSAFYSGIRFSPIAFTNMEEAEIWLNSHWI